MLTQFFWFKKASDNHEREFKKNLNIALKEVVKGILKYNNTRGFPPDPVKQVDENTYIVMVNDQINSAVLEHYLVTEFKKFNINQSFEFSIYDCANQKMVEGRYVEGQKESVLVQSKNLPGFKRDNYYFTVYFPHMKSSLFWQMDVWLFSTTVLLIVVVFFGYSLFVILRQKRLSEIQRDFINNMTHEIRTPISTIAISAETLKSPDIIQTPQRLLNYATIIQDEAIKLKTQVERVLSVADNESRIKLYFEKFDLHTLIKGISEQMLMNDKGKKVELILDFQASNAMIKADKLHISNLITNLIDNSMKYSFNEVVITIHTANTKENKLEISFSDNGIGISKEHQKRIFDKFYRVPKGNIHDVKGFGIGLNFVMLITKMHNGSIKVISALNQGTMFKLTLPQA